MTEYAIENGWLVEVVSQHTCGTSVSGHYGAHEPGCGRVPLSRIEDLLGAQVEEYRLRGAMEALADQWECRPPDPTAEAEHYHRDNCPGCSRSDTLRALLAPAPASETARCSCGNRFDGDNLCMASACQWEGIDERAPEADIYAAVERILAARQSDPNSILASNGLADETTTTREST